MYLVPHMYLEVFTRAFFVFPLYVNLCVFVNVNLSPPRAHLPGVMKINPRKLLQGCCFQYPWVLHFWCQIMVDFPNYVDVNGSRMKLWVSRSPQVQLCQIREAENVFRAAVMTGVGPVNCSQFLISAGITMDFSISQHFKPISLKKYLKISILVVLVWFFSPIVY